MAKTIQFKYLNSNGECYKDDKNLWGCCCKCLYHLEVFKHCCHSPKTNTCVCSESLGFYVCTCFDGERGANIMGLHGLCEMFTPNPLNEPI